MTPAEWRAGGRSTRHRGHEIFFRDHGSGDAALVLIHGFPTSSFDWHALWSPLAERFPRVVAVDMIGFGFSAKPAAYAYSILDQADLHEGLLAELGVARAHLLAHDYGDTVAQELLARHAERRGRGLALESCVMLNGGLFPEVHRARLIQKLLLTPLGPLLARLTNRRSFGASFAAIFGPHTRPSEQELDRFWELITHNDGHRVMHRLIRYIPERRKYRERWVGALQAPGVRRCLIDGPEDPVSGAHMVARWRELVPDAAAVELPGIGHYPQVEDPAAVLRAFDAFHGRG